MRCPEPGGLWPGYEDQLHIDGRCIVSPVRALGVICQSGSGVVLCLALAGSRGSYGIWEHLR